MALGQTGMWRKQTAEQGGTCVRKEESGNYPWVWLCFCFSAFFPSPTFTPGLLKKPHIPREAQIGPWGRSVVDKPAVDSEGHE